jgi:hypothetical protein
MTDDEQRRIARIEAKIDELLKIARRLWDKENAPPPPPPRPIFRRRSDGGWDRWLGEGSGYGIFTGEKLPPDAEIIGEKKQEKKA